VAAIAGESSGAILALEAARAGVATDSVIAYEPPFIVDDSRPPLPADYVEHLDELVAAGDHEGAHRYFLTAAIGLPAEFADGITQAPIWPLLEPVAPTIAYDGRISRDYMAGSAEPLARFAEIAVPVLAVAGDQTEPFIIDGVRALAGQAPRSEFVPIPGGTHQIDPALVGPVYAEFVSKVAG
jgi:pimeloyl-ACP methyl ester carboxylesterase